MIVVIFELTVRDGQDAEYFDRAAQLRGELDHQDGFISIERFQALSDPRRYVSISLWRDDAAVAKWRAHGEHREAQAAGKASVFSEYRLIVAESLREYHFKDGVRELVTAAAK